MTNHFHQLLPPHNAGGDTQRTRGSYPVPPPNVALIDTDVRLRAGSGLCRLVEYPRGLMTTR
ncbi:MAG: hypothetical protein ACO3FE_04445 [Planctomycetaceae bacterium]